MGLSNIKSNQHVCFLFAFSPRSACFGPGVFFQPRKPNLQTSGSFVLVKRRGDFKVLQKYLSSRYTLFSSINHMSKVVQSSITFIHFIWRIMTIAILKAKCYKSKVFRTWISLISLVLASLKISLANIAGFLSDLIDLFRSSYCRKLQKFQAWPFILVLFSAVFLSAGSSPAIHMFSPSITRPSIHDTATTVPSTVSKEIVPDPRDAKESESAKNLLKEAWTLIDQHYVDPTFNGINWSSVLDLVMQRNLNTKEDGNSTLEYMLSILSDPYTRPIKLTEIQKYKGDDVGIGLEISKYKLHNMPFVIKIVPNSPASHENLRIGDLIANIDGQSTVNINTIQISKKLLGKEGSTVELGIVRQRRNPEDRLSNYFHLISSKRINKGSVVQFLRTKLVEFCDLFGNEMEMNTHKVRIERKRYCLPSISASMHRVIDKHKNERVVAYLKIHEFTLHTSAEVTRKLGELGSYDMLVLDLRNNSGGVLEEALKTYSLFSYKYRKLKLVQFFFRNPRMDAISNLVKTKSRIEATRKDRMFIAPQIVLVNRNSASASEVLASSLKDNCQSFIYGKSTFGKNTIQSVHELSEDMGVAITIGRYSSPSGESLKTLGEGLEPGEIWVNEEKFQNPDEIVHRLIDKEIEVKAKQHMKMCEDQLTYHHR